MRLGAGLGLPAAVVLLAGLVLLAVGILRMPSSVIADGGYNTVAIGAPAYAALYTADGEVTGRAWLVAGTALTFLGWAALLLRFVRARGRAARPVASRPAVRRLAAATIVLGLVLLAVGLVQVPRHLDLSELFGRLPDHFPKDFLSPPIAVPGRTLMDLGTALVTLGGAGLLGSGLARRRLHSAAAPTA